MELSLSALLTGWSISIAWAQVEDTTRRYRFRDSPADATGRQRYAPPWMLPEPSGYEVIYELTPDGKGYWVYERIGGRNIRPPSYITREEYERFQSQKFQRQYLDRRSEKPSSADEAEPPQTLPNPPRASPASYPPSTSIANSFGIFLEAGA